MKQLFIRLGLNEKESNVFLKMLELGAQPISIIAKHVGIPRSTMYLLIENLKKAHLIESFQRADILYVKAIPVRQIFDVIRSKERELEQTTKILEEQLPQLEAIENKLSITPRIKFFEGKAEVMKMYESVLKEKSFVAVFNPELVKKFMPEYHYQIPETMAENKCNAKEILVDSSVAREYKKLYESKNHKIKILKKSVSFESDTIICFDKIYMISYGAKDLSAIEIWNKSLAETQYVLFNELWKSNQ